MALGILIARVVLGLAMSAHGMQKLFGWFGGIGLRNLKGFMESVGFYPGGFFAVAVGLTELVSGLLTTLGLLGPVGPASMILVMIVAIGVVHLGHGFFAATNGIELPLLFATGALALAFAGPGAYSLDALFGLDSIWRPELTWALIAAAVIGAGLNLAVRRAPQTAPHAA